MVIFCIRGNVRNRRIRDSDGINPHWNPYIQGWCHIHAIASARVHESCNDDARFLLVIDYDHSVYQKDVECVRDHLSIIHIYSLHDFDGQTIARDVMGDRLEKHALEECTRLFGLNQPWTRECRLDELMSLTRGTESRDVKKNLVHMLEEVKESDVLSVMEDETVTAPLSLMPDQAHDIPSPEIE